MGKGWCAGTPQMWRDALNVFKYVLPSCVTFYRDFVCERDAISNRDRDES
jgi:hypothetical protein